MDGDKIIIGFSGKIGSGKTTAVEDLQKVLRDIELFPANINFADALKRLVIDMFFPSDWLSKEIPPLKVLENRKNDVLPCGLTVRQVLQKVGEFFRSLDPDVWVTAWKSSVVSATEVEYRSNPEVVLVGDVRYPNEVQAIHDMGGKVIRFTRTTAPDDQHKSEIALDDFIRIFDAIVDNSNMSVEEQNDFVWDLIIKRGWLE
jgi:hypothetical protein